MSSARMTMTLGRSDAAETETTRARKARLAKRRTEFMGGKPQSYYPVATERERPMNRTLLYSTSNSRSGKLGKRQHISVRIQEPGDKCSTGRGPNARGILF